MRFVQNNVGEAESREEAESRCGFVVGEEIEVSVVRAYQEEDETWTVITEFKHPDKEQRFALIEKLHAASKELAKSEQAKANAEAALDAAEKFIAWRCQESVSVVDVGQQVIIVGPNIKGRVEELRVRKDGVKHVVAWWTKDNEKLVVELSSDEFIFSDEARIPGEVE